jgi:hypothetical protein
MVYDVGLAEEGQFFGRLSRKRAAASPAVWNNSSIRSNDDRSLNSDAATVYPISSTSCWTRCMLPTSAVIVRMWVRFSSSGGMSGALPVT